MNLETELKDPTTQRMFSCRVDYDLDDYYDSADPDAKPTGQEASINTIEIEAWSDDYLEHTWWPIWESDRYHKGGISSAIWDSLKKQAIEAVENSLTPDEQEAPDDMDRAEYYCEKRIIDSLEAKE